jgi:peptidoglycan/LPS O-acetylase OafA/YrhL
MINNLPKLLKEKTVTNSEDDPGTIKNITYLDGCRVLAIIFVLVAHF